MRPREKGDAAAREKGCGRERKGMRPLEKGNSLARAMVALLSILVKGDYGAFDPSIHASGTNLQHG